MSGQHRIRWVDIKPALGSTPRVSWDADDPGRHSNPGNTDADVFLVCPDAIGIA